MSVQQAQPNKTAVKRKRRFGMDNFELALLGLPVVVWYIVFCYLPMFGIIIAFKKYNPNAGRNFVESLFKSDWVGFSNFRFIFQTPDALRVFRNTILYNAVFIVTGILLSVTLAILMSMLHSQVFAKICQTMMFLPHFLSMVVVGYFVFSFLSMDKGLLNQILKWAGKQPVLWYMEPKYWPFFMVFIYLWKSMGYSMVVYLASIAGIDTSLYEAASIDGASKWHQVRYIMIPLLTPIITIMFILAVGRIFMSDFGMFYFVPRRSGQLANVVQTVDVYVYNALMSQNNLGFAAGASVTQALFGFVTIFAANRVVKTLNPENSLF